MKLLKATIHNFKNISEATIALDNQGLIAIQGINEDDPSASSNGAGKSTIFDAICWGLFGKTAKNEAADEVVNIKVGKDCRVEVAFQNDDRVDYAVVRHRKHYAYGNDLYFMSFTPAFCDLTKGTRPLTQKLIEETIGCTADIFMSAIYLGQENVVDLPLMTDGQLKNLIEEAAGITQIKEAYELAKKERDELREPFNQLVSDGDSQELLFASKQRDLSNLRGKQKDWVALRERKMDFIKINKMALEQCVRDLIAKPEYNIDYSQLVDEIVELETEVRKQLKQPKEDPSKPLQIERATVEGQRKQYRQALDKLKKEKESIEKKIGTACSECGKEILPEDLSSLITSIDSKISKVEEKLKDFIEQLSDIDGKLSVIASNERKEETENDTATTNYRRLETLREALRKYDEIDRQIKSNRTALEAEEKKLKELEAETNPFDEPVKETEYNINNININILNINKKIDELKQELSLIDQTMEVFGPAGVRAHILDTVTPFLNEKTSEYLTLLSDGKIQATWSTLTTNGKGELRENFKIVFTKEGGAGSFKSLSGGEKRKGRLATVMALQDLIASRAEKPIDLFIADEIDAGLDEPGMERLMQLLEKKARERGSVFVISHNSLKSWCSSVITIRNKDGLATLETEL